MAELSSSPKSPLSAVSTPPSSPPSETPTRSKMEVNGGADEPFVHVSSTMLAEEEAMRMTSRKQDEVRERELDKERAKDINGGSAVLDPKFKALEYLLSQSKLYSAIMLAQMQKQEETEIVKDEKTRKRALKREETAEKAAQASQRRSTRVATSTTNDADELGEDLVAEDTRSLPMHTRSHRSQVAPKAKGPASKIANFIKKEELEGKAGKGKTVCEVLHEEVASAESEGVKSGDIGVQNLRSARQPDLISGGTMRGYQLEGLEWLTSLYENGLNGILADEMGLGKTIQTIAFLAFLREKGVYGPFLIASPLSTTGNWVEEFHKFAPKIPVVLYHGSKTEREDIRRKRLRNPGSPSFPVICTSYEICMNDRKYLSHYGWKYIIIDEGHRIKNLNCRLIRELQSYQSANRLLITGTPLQNNLTELWSLLHFLMPDIFDKLESFESWFDFSALKERNGFDQILSEERQKSLVTSLHAILKPFLLRRVKTDVEQSLPKKREYILYAPLTMEQRELYQEILKGNSRAYLEDKVVETLSRTASRANTPTSIKSKGSTATLKRKAAEMHESGTSTPNKSAKTSRASTPAREGAFLRLGRRAKKSQNYEEISDNIYFKQVEAELPESSTSEDSGDQDELERAATLLLAKKQIAQKKLQNPIMQLRLCCNSPHNFYDPFIELEETSSSDNQDYNVLVTASGKMLLLDRLMTGLLSAAVNHKILIFSQFKTQLDLLEIYFEQVRHLPACRIDGSVAAVERQEQIRLFNSSKEHRVFLLSTRAGGQGINLAAADTVILFDSDWNPQQDLQAQDRAHRIGQTRNVIVYRFATKGTVEEILLEKADGKRRLEKLVISKGKFKQWGGRGRKKKIAGRGEEDEEDEDSSIAELKRLLGQNDGEKFDFANADKQGGDLLTDKDLHILIDRSEEAYTRAEKGLDGGDMFKAVETTTDGSGLLEQMSK